MQNISIPLMDLIQICLFVLACYGCYRRGVSTGIKETMEFLEDKGFIEIEEKD
jgi:hypothetical protein